MTGNRVMKLWTTLITALLALCTTLGLITTSAAAAVPQAETARNSGSLPLTAPAASPWSESVARALPPTMKQRIRAEAHGSSPSCRHHGLTDPSATTDSAHATDSASSTTDSADSTALTDSATNAQ